MTLLKNLKRTFDIFIYLCHFLDRPTKGHILDAKRFKVNLRIPNLISQYSKKSFVRCQEWMHDLLSLLIIKCPGKC